MAWIQEGIISPPERTANGGLRIVVRFTNGALQVDEAYGISDKPSGNWLGARVTATLARLDALDAEAAKFHEGEPVDVTPDPVKPPSQDDLDRQAWLDAKQAYQIAVKELAGGLGTTKQADVDAAYALMKSLYRPEYGVFL